MSVLKIIHDDHKELDSKKCIGRFFRCARNGFRCTQRGVYNFQVKFKPLRSLSCPGCDRCDFTAGDDELYMFERWVDCYGDLRHVIEANHGDIFKLIVTNVSTCPETGYVDDYDLEFHKVDKTITQGGKGLIWVEPEPEQSQS